MIDALIGKSRTADSVVLGSRGLGGFAGLVVGSVGLGAAGHAAGPAVIVRGSPSIQHDRVVAGYDGSAHSDAAMQYAVDQARARDVPLHVVHAWQTPIASPYAATYQSLARDVHEEEIRAAEDRVAVWRDKNPDVRITGEEVAGHPVSVLSRAAGRAGRRGAARQGLGGGRGRPGRPAAARVRALAGGGRVAAARFPGGLRRPSDQPGPQAADLEGEPGTGLALSAALTAVLAAAALAGAVVLGGRGEI
ncbi:universal stress protein [Nonomuraea sp. PA05]|uniref:universal stress protein n=1 Tax=Nonomuraea sp. PA05 TaxID=2604466 RepID=UPI001652A725|nr:universal stress protein [Nonomuraea sp. PA05]